MGEGTRHVTSKGLQYSFDCIFCDDTKERLFFNLDRQVFYCQNCEVRGSTITFIMLYNHVEYTDALKIFRDLEGYLKPLPEDLEQEIYSRLYATAAVEKKKYIYPLPEEFILIEDARGKSGTRAIDYLKGRGITMAMAEKYYIGYCAEGKYKNRIIMPDFEDGELVYWQARTWLPTPKALVMKKMFRKVMNPSLTEEQIEDGIVSMDKSQIIGNIDLIRQQGMGVLCEGKMDGYSIGDIGGCLHGKHMSDDQLIKLVMNKDRIGTLAVMLDGDAFDSAIITAKRLYQYFDEVLVCRIPKDKDPNTLGREGILQALTDSIPYTPMFSIKARLKGW